MAKIDSDKIKHILSMVDIVDVIGDYVELTKRGSRYVGLCPFHDDRHLGNFVVYPRGNCYKCFACDAKGGVVDFLMKHANMTYRQAIEELAHRAGVSLEQPYIPVSRTITKKEYRSLPTLRLPFKMVERYKGIESTLTKWINKLNWSESQRKRIPEILDMYHVGTSKFGHTIFWQIDDTGGVRTGKMMKYLPNGHRDKNNRGSFAWVHHKLLTVGKWSDEQFEMRQTLFGMHLLLRYPKAEVHIVESEKTALLCSIFFGDLEHHIWMATGGKSNLTKEKLAPIINSNRIISLHPDKDGVDEWKERLDKIFYKKSYINQSIIYPYWKPEDGDKADIADILVRLITERDNQTSHVSEVIPRTEICKTFLINNKDA